MTSAVMGVVAAHFAGMPRATRARWIELDAALQELIAVAPPKKTPEIKDCLNLALAVAAQAKGEARSLEREAKQMLTEPSLRRQALRRGLVGDQKVPSGKSRQAARQLAEALPGVWSEGFIYNELRRRRRKT